MNGLSLRIIFLCEFFIFTYSNNCSWSFRPIVEDLTRGLLSIDVSNPSNEIQEYSQNLDCPTLEILNYQTISSIFTVPAREMRQLPVVLEILSTASSTKHNCVLKQWPKNKQSQFYICNIPVLTYKGTEFLLPCNKSSLGTFDLQTVVPQTGSMTVRLQHFGEPTSYTAQIECSPEVNFIYNGFIYKLLTDQKIWEIPLAPNCSNAININYFGTCKLSIYYLCQELIPVQVFKFLYQEGKNWVHIRLENV